MLQKIHGRPLWYKTWVIVTGFAALYTVSKFFGIIFTGAIEEVPTVDFILAAFVQLSLLIDTYLFQKKSKRKIPMTNANRFPSPVCALLDGHYFFRFHS
jgi:hypothetical protein